jgi:hypothetical protein
MRDVVFGNSVRLARNLVEPHRKSNSKVSFCLDGLHKHVYGLAFLRFRCTSHSTPVNSDSPTRSGCRGTIHVSIQAFEGALSANTDACLAVVSESLFFKLDQQARVKIEQVQMPFNRAHLGDGPVRRFLRAFVQKMDQPVTFTYFVMEGPRHPP